MSETIVRLTLRGPTLGRSDPLDRREGVGVYGLLPIWELDVTEEHEEAEKHV